MPVFSPRRYQPPFYPLRRDDIAPWVWAFTVAERNLKSVLFGCRMCGNCLLQETAFVCPLTCPKGLRNGLCGGASEDHCEVDPTRPCTWFMIYRRAERLGMLDKLLEVNPPIDGSRAGHETWLDLIRFYRERKQGPYPQHFITDRERFNRQWEAFFRDLRQPDWWQGDAEYHAPVYEAPASFLEASLRTGRFVVTAEIAPPLGASGDIIRKKVGWLSGYVTAANFTDNASASARMNSLAASHMCLEAGLEPVMQLQTRDRTRTVLQSDAMGAAGLGIRNILCLSGDHHRFGPDPIAKPDQFDMDAVQLVWMLRRMRDEHIYLDGRGIKQPPMFFLGAAGSPYGALPQYEAIRAEKKINAGAQFIQTQPVFDYDGFVSWLEALDKRNLLDKVYVLAGIVPLKSANAAHFMADSVPGVKIPDELIRRMDQAEGKEAQQETGVAIALEIIEKLKATPGISGIHVMAVHWEDIVARLVTEAGLPLPLASESGIIQEAAIPGA